MELNFLQNENEIDSSFEYNFNTDNLEESEKKEYETRNIIQYEIFANKFRRDTLQGFLYPKSKFNEISDDLETNYKGLFFNDFEKPKYLKQLGKRDFINEFNINQNSANRSSIYTSYLLSQDNLHDEEDEKNLENNNENTLLEFYENEIKNINRELLKDPQNLYKYNKNIELYSKLDKLNIIQADFLNINAIEEIKVPKKNLSQFNFLSENCKDRNLLRQPLDSLILSKGKDINNLIDKKSNNERTEKENFDHIYNFSFDQNKRLSFNEMKDFIENSKKSTNEINEKSILNKMLKNSRASVLLLRKSNVSNFSNLENLISQNENPLKKMFHEKKYYNEKGILSFDIRYNFKGNLLEKYFKENLENQDEIDFIKLINYKNGNKINFLEKIHLIKNNSLKNNDALNTIITNDSSHDFTGNYKLGAAINIKSLERRAELFIDPRTKPINNTLKKIFRVLSNIKKQAENRREKKISLEKESKLKNKKSMLKNYQLTKKLSYIGEDINNESHRSNSDNDSLEKFKNKNDYDNLFDKNENEEFMKSYNSNFMQNQENEKDSISFGKEESDFSQNIIKSKTQRSIMNINNEENITALHKQKTLKNYPANELEKSKNESNNHVEELNITEEKALEYDRKLKMILSKNRRKKKDLEKYNKRDKEDHPKAFNLENKNYSNYNLNKESKDYKFDKSQSKSTLNNIVLQNENYEKSREKIHNISNKFNRSEKIENQEMRSIPRDININALKNFIHDEINKGNLKK